MKKLLIAVSLILILCGCGEPPKIKRGEYPLPKGVEISKCEVGKYGGVFVLSGSREPMTFNELVNSESETSMITSMMFSTLTTYNPITQEVVPCLAERWEIGGDGKTYKFFLREGVKFSDGVEFTADDVIFTFDAIFSPQRDKDGNVIFDKETKKPLLRYPSRYAGQYTIGGEFIKYRKLDKYTVEFSTSKIYAPFLTDIGFMSILPKHKLWSHYENGSLREAWSTETAIKNPQEIVSLGAFKLFSYKPGERLVLCPNPHYWRADKDRKRLPYIDFLIFKFVADTNTSTILFATGQSDASTIDVNDYEWVKRYADTYRFTLYERGASPSIYYFYFNQNSGKNDKGISFVKEYKLKWFKNKKFRKAVMMSLDRDGIVNGVLGGRGVKLHSIISPANKKWYSDKVVKYGHDIGEAKRLLESEGFYFDNGGMLYDSEKNKVEINLLVADGSKISTTMATTIMENLKAIGIKVNLVFMDFATIISKIDDTMDYESAMMGFTGGGDPSGGKAIYRSDGFLHVWNPRQKTPQTAWEKRVDDIIDTQESILDYKKRKEYIDEMQYIFSDELPLLFLTTPMSYSGIKSKWVNVEVPPLGSIIWNIDELYEKDGEE